MKTKFLLLCAVGMLFCSVCVQAQTTININPIKDNTLYENATGSLSNGAGTHFFVGATNQGFKRRGLLKFDIASHVPTGATILEATLTLSMDQTSSVSTNIELHTVFVDWGEGASAVSEIGGVGGGNGATAQTNDATWLHTFYNSSLWSTAGGDFSPSVSATTFVNGIGSYTWASSQLVADVQNWLNSPASNFGWCIIGDEAKLRTTKRFASKEIATLNSRPLLTIVYSSPVNVQETNTGPHCTIYPNPSSGKMQLVVRGISNTEVKIYNIVGIAVCSQRLMADKINIDLSKESGGIYFYELMSNKGIVETGKIIIRKSDTQ